MDLKKIYRFLVNLDIGLLVIIITGAILRFINLGYSDYQGDEIRALYIPVQGEGFFNFLLRQRKGPIQFIITYLTSFIDPEFRNYTIDRLPFALASVISLIFFYKFAEQIFNKKVAFFGTMFICINGFFVALSRILQYQGFVFLFCSMALYYFALLYKNPKKVRYLYIGMFVWGLSILTHYDGIFIAPIMIYMFILWWFGDTSRELSKKALHTVLASLLPIVLCIIFYGALVLSLTTETKQYWSGRITGTTSSKSASSQVLFKVYQPYLSWQVYLGLTLFSLILLGFSSYSLAANNIVRLKNNKFLSNITNWKIVKIFNVKTSRAYFCVLFLWLLFPVIFMEKMVAIPGTHIYTYLLPLSYIFGVTLDWFIEKIRNIHIFSLITSSVLIIFFTFTFYQSYMIFVDNKDEYPWEEEKFLFWSFYPPDIDKYHLSLFGFPYYRNWLAIGDFTKKYPDVKAYTSNENNAVTNYYMRLEKSTDKAGFYIFISHPQNFKNITNNQKYLYWASKNDPVFTVSRSGEFLVNVYLMPIGTYTELLEKGY